MPCQASYERKMKEHGQTLICMMSFLLSRFKASSNTFTHTPGTKHGVAEFSFQDMILLDTPLGEVHLRLNMNLLLHSDFFSGCQ